MKIIKSLLILPLSLLLYAFVSNNNEMNKNDKSIIIEKQAEELLSKMTLEEKIGQMTQVSYMAFVDFNDITKYSIGSVLWGGGPEVDDITPNGWANMSDSLMQYSLKTRLGIPLILGVDAVHGHNNVDGAVVFPHNIGMGCTGNANLVKEAAKVTASEVAATGVHWTFAPCVAVARNERWGRTYESYGEYPSLVAELGAAAVRGYEGEDLSLKTSILSCTKHYVGDGGTTNGTDQGNTEISEAELRSIHLPGYIAAIKENTCSIMASYNSWNGAKLHGNNFLLDDLLKKELRFKGFIVSDWAAIDQLGGDYKSDIEKSINAGIDMVMIPYGPASQGKLDSKGQMQNTYLDFITNLKDLVENNKVPLSRIDDAVKRILIAKFNLDLFNKTKANRDLLSSVGSKEHREVARKCVQQSLVLLKNENQILPISKNIKSILITGKGADDIGMQCGGWTIFWQGKNGNILNGGTTILSAIKNLVSKETKVFTSKDSSNLYNADLVIVVVGEDPYAEGVGDKSDLSLSDEDKKTIANIKKSGKPMVIVLLSGRPLIINDELKMSDAFVVAWLPGTEGKGIADVLFGDVNFTGKLSISWPRSIDQIPINIGDKEYDPLFPYGFGFNYPEIKN